MMYEVSSYIMRGGFIYKPFLCLIIILINTNDKQQEDTHRT